MACRHCFASWDRERRRRAENHGSAWAACPELSFANTPLRSLTRCSASSHHPSRRCASPPSLVAAASNKETPILAPLTSDLLRRPANYDAGKYMTRGHVRLVRDLGLDETHLDVVAKHLVAALTSLGVAQTLVGLQSRKDAVERTGSNERNSAPRTRASLGPSIDPNSESEFIAERRLAPRLFRPSVGRPTPGRAAPSPRAPAPQPQARPPSAAQPPARPPHAARPAAPRN